MHHSKVTKLSLIIALVFVLYAASKEADNSIPNPNPTSVLPNKNSAVKEKQLVAVPSKNYFQSFIYFFKNYWSRFISLFSKNKTEKSKTEKSKTEQNLTEQNKTKQNLTEQNKKE